MKKIILSLCVAALIVTGCSSKPSKSEIESSIKKNALGDTYSSASKQQKEKLDDYISCFVDETYDKVSAKAWNKIKEAKDENDLSDKDVSSKEEKALDAASDKCGDKLQ